MLLALILSAAGASLTAGHHFACARTADGGAACWGANESGQLGDGTRANRATPVRVRGLTGVRDLTAGRAHACAVTGKGQVWCWGSNGPASCGDPFDLELLTPRQVGGLPPMARVFAGDSTTCGVATDGRGFCWGRNLSGELTVARQEDETGRAAPVEVTALGSSAAAFSVADSHVCALTTRGEVWCWGNDEHGRARGTARPGAAPPTRLELPEPAVAIATVNTGSFAILASGALMGWGTWQRDGDFERASPPRRIEEGVRALVHNRYTFFTLGAAGWRFPRSGTVARLAVDDLTWANELAAGDGFVCGRGGIGVRCWGANREGLGAGSASQLAQPTAISLEVTDAPLTRRQPGPAEACPAAPREPPPPPARPTCGNGRLDVVGMSGGQCPPCIPNTECRCAPMVQIMEPCDGAELAGASCQSLGYASGALRCSATCSFDTSDCVPVSAMPPGGEVTWLTLSDDAAPSGALSLAPRGDVLGLTWRAGACGQIVFSRTGPQWKLSSSPPFGRPNAARVATVATASGWLVAASDRNVTWLHAVDAAGKPGPELRAFTGRVVFLIGKATGPYLLGLSTRDHPYLGGLDVVLLDAKGAVLQHQQVLGHQAQASEQVDSLPSQADAVSAVATADGFLVTRGQLVPGTQRGGIVTVALGLDGQVRSRTLVAQQATSPLLLSPTALAFLVNTASSAQPPRFELRQVALDARGGASGAPVRKATLDEGEWVVSDGTDVGSGAVLVSQLDVSMSTLQSSALRRVTVLELPEGRATVVDATRALPPPRLTAWGGALVAVVVVQTNGPTRLGLARLLPARAR